MIHANFSFPQPLLPPHGWEDGTPAQTAAEALARLVAQVQRVGARAAQAATGQGNTGQAGGSPNVPSPEQLGANEVLFDLVCDQERLDRTTEALARLEREVTLHAEDLAVQERRLAYLRQQLATGGPAEDSAWVEIWQANVQHTREGYESMHALLVETRARYAPMIASSEATLAPSRATAGQCHN